MERREGQEGGRKMWRWRSEVLIVAFMVCLVGASRGRFAARSLSLRRWKIMLARRATLKWFSGSKSMMAASWPSRGIEDMVRGRMAMAMMR